ncbi:MAG: PhzF family phenazine biosynthesis protein [Actinomycetota bacterium]
MEFVQVDVFADAAYFGNPLAVFADAEGLGTDQMQKIASEMNLSETTFVIAADRDRYSVRIFTPTEELPFAGHPTIGTAWVLLHLGKLVGNELVQESRAGATAVFAADNELWFARRGESNPDLREAEAGMHKRLARALGVGESSVGLDAGVLDGEGTLRPAFANAGLPQLIVPLRDIDVLARCYPRADLLVDFAGDGVYCFTATGGGGIRARGFFPAVGVDEDPATGSACAALGLYLADRVGPIRTAVEQGVEMGRPSRLELDATPGSVEVGGTCVLVLNGELACLP